MKLFAFQILAKAQKFHLYVVYDHGRKLLPLEIHFYYPGCHPCKTHWNIMLPSWNRRKTVYHNIAPVLFRASKPCCSNVHHSKLIQGHYLILGSLTIICPILFLASFNHVAWHWSLPGGMESVVVISMAGVVFRKTQLTTVTVISRDIKETFHDWNVSLPGSHSNQEECFRSAVQLPHLYPCHGWTNWAHLARLSCKWFYSSCQEAVTKRVSSAL